MSRNFVSSDEGDKAFGTDSHHAAVRKITGRSNIELILYGSNCSQGRDSFGSNISKSVATFDPEKVQFSSCRASSPVAALEGKYIPLR